MNSQDLPDVSDRLRFAIDAAQEAGRTAMRWFQSEDLETSGKADGSPVTQADRAAEISIREAIAATYPDDGILGEEYESVVSSTGLTWVIDPIDGTKSFVHGVPLFGTLLACMREGLPTIGVIVMPALGEWVAAEAGRGCWWWREGRGVTRARVSDRAGVKGSMLVSTSYEYYDTESRKRAWASLNDEGAHTRGWSDCYAFVLLATGRADGVIEPATMNLWDIACVPVIVGEAGGAWSDINGAATLDTGSIVATNGLIHERVLELMNPA
ncbi:MAG: inositol monophosphatase family protein [Planctomycetota bacterium]